MQVSIKLRSILVLACLVGSTLLRFFLPENEGLTIRLQSKSTVLFLPFNRLAFWTGLIVALLVILVTFFERDFGLR